MGNIINFPRKKKEESFEETLSEMMKKACSMKEDVVKEGDIYLSDLRQFENTIRTNIFNVLTGANCQNSDYFHCGEYISSLIRQKTDSPPESFYVIDYLDKIETMEEFHNWQKAADLCFLLCSVFRERCDHGMMNYNSYLIIGKGLYATFYSKSKKKIGFLMSSNYKTMVMLPSRH